ncbi:hypothetical protein GA417_05550 [Poseidonibacter ostreae]|uniref:plasmid mobilization protein n=1 Tax=Poseidonibacter ostreae TaxID=2654171 RepID=UPI00126547E8|nr:hypothetical protein [Poseidonibacter ostreae]KAB7886415.1 hypothetical protein GA417_05550 [Poseidonibacter ostreae]
MSRDIKKTIRFSTDEFKSIEIKMKNYDIDFATFSRKALLNQKIKFPFEKEILYELNCIYFKLEEIAKKIDTSSKMILLRQLREIEIKVGKLI